MRARVEIGEEDVIDHMESAPQGFLRKRETIELKYHFHTVAAMLDLTEEERAVIQKYSLGSHVLDDRPKHSKEEVERTRNAQMQSSLLTDKHASVREMGEQGIAEYMARYEAERNIVTVADLLASPFKRQFESAFRAAEYSRVLKTTILPALASLVKENTNIPLVETLEF